MIFQGSMPALVTPFRNGKVDEKAFVELVERQVAAGTHGLVVAGTTGEASTLSLASVQRRLYRRSSRSSPPATKT